jgi:hypothetical protein
VEDLDLSAASPEDLVKWEPGEALYDNINLADKPFLTTTPETIIKKFVDVLKPGGTIAFAFLNLSFHRVIEEVLEGDTSTPHMYMRSSQRMAKTMLEMGTIPQLLTPEDKLFSSSPKWNRLLGVLSENIGRDADWVSFQLSCPYFIMKCTRQLPVDETDYPGVCFVVGTSGTDKKFALNAARCPAFLDPRNQVIIRSGNTSPKELFEKAYAESTKDLIVYTHQDMYFPSSWGARFWRSLQEAETKFGKVGLAGLFGVSGNRDAGGRIESGCVVDTLGARVLIGSTPIPAKVKTLDGILLAWHKDVKYEIDPEMGFHFYDAHLALQAEKMGLPVVALNAPAFHASVFRGPDKSFVESEKVFKKVWQSALPMEVPCKLITKD